jgi:hypothetical protein
MSERDERIAAGRITHGVGMSEDFPGNVCHLVSPLVGHLRLLERDGRTLNAADLAHYIERLSLVLDMADADTERADSHYGQTSPGDHNETHTERAGGAE